TRAANSPANPAPLDSAPRPSACPPLRPRRTVDSRTPESQVAQRKRRLLNLFSHPLDRAPPTWPDPAGTRATDQPKTDCTDHRDEMGCIPKRYVAGSTRSGV